ncbi:Zinc protease [Methylophaga thiooxydans]|uniref:Zinc protease n=1 Tax=Methylophaga thiooxydans TaxID=392484 RepID=A0A0A0BEQ5_9GAMM|nr:pitrilysin family protein [Methylophaga thiooxydans]KGM06441.1 Zinc protease [Methylophaga thiooxydans]
MFAKKLFLIVTLLVSWPVLASPDIQHWQTDNGAKVLFVNAPELPMVDINVVFNAGAARDGDLPGTARLTSAMLDEGAADMNADEIATAFAKVGAKFSASSERDMAVLSLRSLTEEQAFTDALDVFTEVLSSPSFPQDSFLRIQQQLLTGLQAEKQSPSAMASRAFYANLYGKHPYSEMPAGQPETVSKITVADLKRFYQQYYVSQNAVVVIVGAVDKSKANDIAETLMSGLEQGEPAPAIAEVQSLTESALVSISYPSSQTTILVGQTGISRDDPDYFPLYVGNHILGGSGLVSQLSDEIREKRGLTYGVYSYFRPMQKQGPYQLGLQTRNDQTQEALSVLKQTLNTFIENGPTEQEITAAKQNITGGFALRVDSNNKIADYLSMIGFYNLPLDYLDSFNDKVKAVTVADIKDAFKRRIHADKMLTVLVGGETEQNE